MALAKLMKNTVFNFHFFGLRYSVGQTAIYGSIGLVVVGALCAYFLGGLTVLDSLIAGILAMLLHWLGEILHQYGHYLASKAVGHPMIGARLWTILGTSLYRADEGKLPAQTHIRRALGGPAMSFAMLLVGILLWFGVGNLNSPMMSFLVAWWIWEHILIYAGGAMIPINYGGFATDAGTILHWLRNK